MSSVLLDELVGIEDLIDEDYTPSLEEEPRLLSPASLTETDRLLFDGILDMDNILGRIDYPFFVQVVLGHDFPEIRDPTVQARLQKVGQVFKDWLLNRDKQEVFRKVAFCHPRGTCKSSGSTIPLMPFAALSDPNLAGMTASANYDKMAVKFVAASKQVWEGAYPKSRLVEMYGEFKPRNTRDRPWSKKEMVIQPREDVAIADPTLAPFSVGHGPTSGHFDVAGLDDLVTWSAMERDMYHLDKAWDLMIEMRNTMNNDGLLVYSFTRYDDGDPWGRVITDEIQPKVEALHNGRLPADWHERNGWLKYAHLAGWEVFYDEVLENYDEKTGIGDPVYPTIWPLTRINELRSTPRGEAVFQSQLMQQPSARSDRPLTREMIESLFIDTINDIPESDIRCLKTIDFHCDFAFKDAEAYAKQTGDYGVLHVCGKFAGKVYRLNGYRGKVTQQEFGHQISRMMAWVWKEFHTKVRYITYEQTTGHGSGDESTRLWLHEVFMQNTDIPRATPYPIRRTKQGNKTKLQRIMDTNWAWQDGNVVLIREAPNNDFLVHQMLNQGYTQHDDDADAFADAFHEKLYKKTRKGDLPEEVAQYMPGSGRDWTPMPCVHGNVNQRGRFTAEHRSARNPSPNNPSLFGAILGKNR